MAVAHESNVFTARQLLSRHLNPEAAFAPVDGTNSGAVSLSNARNILRTLTGVSLTPVELTALARKYGDGKAFKYRDFLADRQLLPHNDVKQAVVNERSSAERSERSGTPGRRTGLNATSIDGAAASAHRSERKDKEAAIDSLAQSTDSRFLQFGSDSLVTAPILHGGSSAPMVAMYSRERARASHTPVDVQRRKAEYGVVHAPVLGTALDHVSDDLNVDAVATRSGSGASTPRSTDALYHTGSIAQAGGLSDFMHVSATVASDSLPVFPGDAKGRRRPMDSHLFHQGAVARCGQLGNFIMDSSLASDLVSRGQLPPLPMSTRPDLPVMAPRDPEHRTGALLQAGSVHLYGADADGLAAELSRTRQAHSYPEIHGGRLQDAGGLGALANESDSWLKLQRPSLKQGEYSTCSTPRSKSAGRERSEITGEGMRRSGSARRRSMPGMIAQIEHVHEGQHEDGSLPQEVHTLEPLYSARSPGSAGTERAAGFGLTSMSASRRHAALGGVQGGEQSMQGSVGTATTTVERTTAGSIGGPISSADCAQLLKPMAFGARSPIAMSLASSSLARFDVNKLAKMRQTMRAALPEKETSAAALVRARLGGIDRDGDGAVTASELFHGLAELCPAVDAAAVGMLIKYLRYKPTENSSTSLENVDGFGEAVPVAAVTSWLLEQAGGRAEVLSPLSATGVQGVLMGQPSLSQDDCVQNSPRPVIARREPSTAGSQMANDSVVSALPTLIDTNSSAMAAALHHTSPLTADQTPAAGKSSGREQSILNAPYSSSDYGVEKGLDWTTASLCSSLLTGRGKVSSYSELHRKKVTHAISGEFARGDTSAPAAGASSQRQRSREAGLGTVEGALTTDRTQWAQTKEKFETFKANWEAKHGAPATKEMTADAAEPVPGPTWARASPSPFRVLRMVVSPPVPGAL